MNGRRNGFVPVPGCLSVIFCLDYSISLCYTVSQMFFWLEIHWDQQAFLEKKKSQFTESDCFRFISSVFLLASQIGVAAGMGIGIGLRGDISWAWNRGPCAGLAQGAGAWKMCLGRWERRPIGREEDFQAKPGLFQEFILRKLRTPFSLSSLVKEGRELKLVKNLLCARDFTYIMSFKALCYF